MKKTALCMVIFSLLVPVTPLLCLGLVRDGLSLPAVSPPREPAALAAPEEAPAPPGEELLLLWDEGEDRLLELTPLDYIVGAVASEMPVSWPDEALRAQGIASHSYLLFKRDHPDPAREQEGWHTVNSALRQGYMSEAVMASFWGDAWQENRDRLRQVLEPVADTVLLWEGRPADACYHAISCGHTENSRNVWGEELPYLTGVASPLDATSPDWEDSVRFSAGELRPRLEPLGCNLSGEPGGWFGPPSLTPAGYVGTLSVGGVSLTGPQLRAALGLRSACFSVTADGDDLTFTTRGYGHGVGLSQYGAKALALTGKTHRDILAAYFPGTELCPDWPG